MKLGLLVLVLCVTAATTAMAGAWTKKKDHYYAKISYNSFSSTEEFDTTGARTHLNYLYSNLDKAEFLDKSFSLYGEYGFGDKLTGIAAFSLKNYTSSFYNSVSRRTEKLSASGLGDLNMGLRYQVLLSPFAAAVQGSVKLPLASNNHDIPLSTGFVDAELRIALGGSVPLGIQNYAQAEAGYRHRGGPEFEDMGVYLAEVGVYATESLLLKMAVDGVWSIGTPIIDYPLVPPTPGYALWVWREQYFMRLLGGAIYRISQSVDVSVEVASFAAGRNTLAGEMLLLGVALKTP